MPRSVSGRLALTRGETPRLDCGDQQFGSNGSFKATQKELAKICGASAAAVRREIKELADENYWAAENLAGANRYTIIPQNERQQMWSDAERDWQRQVHKWAAAKMKWKRRVERWLDAENQAAWYAAELPLKMDYTMPIFSMLSKHVGYEAAESLAEAAWVRLYIEGGVPLDNALQMLEAHYASEPEVSTQASDTNTQASDASTQAAHLSTQAAHVSTKLLTPVPLTSRDDDCHKSFRVRQDRQGLDKNVKTRPLRRAP